MWIGLTTLLITATRLQFLVLGGVVFALFVLVDWLVLRREWTRGAWARLIAGAALGLVLSLPDRAAGGPIVHAGRHAR